MSEVLDSHDGGPLPPTTPSTGGSRWSLRRGLLAGGALVGLTAAGVGAWAAYQFFSTGPQPAEALPASTLGYVSIDLDPSGGQKIAAVQTLNKFPKFKDSLGLSTKDDLRKTLFQKIEGTGACPGVDYDQDIAPWLGDRAALAAVDVGDAHPDVVVVLQVKDADKADAGLTKLKGCDDSGAGQDVGWKIDNGWAVVAESTAIADKVADATAKGSLADDADFQKWTGATGDSGILTLYAAPSAGDYLADHVEHLFDFPFSPFASAGEICSGSASGSATAGATPSQAPSSSSSDGGTFEGCYTTTSSLTPKVPDSVTQKLRDFKGAAATIRFSNGGLEVEVAGDSSAGSTSFLSGGGAADAVTSLPSDTGAALGVGFRSGWFSQLVAQLAPSMGKSADQLMKQLSRASGLDLPADAETLGGRSAALAIGADGKSLSGDDPSKSQVAVKVVGDPAAIDKVLDKVRAQAGGDEAYFASDASGGTIVIGPDADYRQAVLRPGDLGGDRVFKDVVPDASKATSILFVDLDRFDSQIEDMVGNDPDLIANLEVISGLGVESWTDGDTTHGVLRISTD